MRLLAYRFLHRDFYASLHCTLIFLRRIYFREKRDEILNEHRFPGLLFLIQTILKNCLIPSLCTRFKSLFNKNSKIKL